jgi:putative phosphoribosyl transferase
MTPRIPYRNRSEAGRFLAGHLAEYQATPGALVLGLPMGGIPVAAEVASVLHMPLDALVVRKLEVTREPGLTLGAVAPEGIQVLDHELIRALGVSAEEVDRILRRERAELERGLELYGGQTPDWKDRTVILIDDAAESGWTMLAAIRFARKHTPRQVVAALPVGSASALERFRHETDRCVCPVVREVFSTVSDWYRNFPPTTQSEVTQLLEGNRAQAKE